MTFNHIAIIYNPKSTGQSAAAATDLYLKLRKSAKSTGVEMLATKYAGHAVDLAEIAGRNRVGCLIVSVGGDGTFHEVINGVMRLPQRGRPVVALLPAGNANDHARATGKKTTMMTRLSESQVMPMDMLMIKTLNPAGADLLRYAHSYIGFGMTGRIAGVLNASDSGPVSEKGLVLRELMRPKPFEIVSNKRVKRLFSLLCTNVETMAKYMTVAEKKDINGKYFAVLETPARTRGELFKEVLMLAVGQAGVSEVTSRYSFLTITSMPVQMDGEVAFISAGATVTVSLAAGAINVLA